MRCYKDNIQVSKCASSILLNKPSWEHINSTLKEDRAVPLHASPLTIVPFAKQLHHLSSASVAALPC